MDRTRLRYKLRTMSQFDEKVTGNSKLSHFLSIAFRFVFWTYRIIKGADFKIYQESKIWGWFYSLNR
jgi:hypothetical protein